MNLVPPHGSLAALLNQHFFALGSAWWLLMLIMGVIAIGSYLAGQLNVGGALAAFLVGFGTTWILGFAALATLLFFFLSAGVLSKISKRLRGVEMRAIHAKGSRRDAMQVLANGLMALVAALLYASNPSIAYLAMFGASVGEAASDTFAGEVGILSPADPISIITGKPMKRGLSGAITALGLAAGLLGAILIALIVWTLMLPPGVTGLAQASVIALAAFFGCLIDSVLGATIQAHYWDEQSKRITEHRYRGDRELPLERGIRWVDNDVVNLLSNTTSALLALSLTAILQ
jgi:uncharacterized protein (TIGR00297 family)